MKMQKGGICRRVKPHRLQEFKEKGYAEMATGVEVALNPFKRLTTAELEQKALEMEVDLSDCKNNEERASKLFSAMEE